MTTTEYRPGRHARIASDLPSQAAAHPAAAHSTADRGDDPNAVTAAFAAVTRSAAPLSATPVDAAFPADRMPHRSAPVDEVPHHGPAVAGALPRTAAAHAGVSQPAASYPMPYGAPQAPQFARPAAAPQVAVPAQRAAADIPVPPTAGHWPTRTERPSPPPRKRRRWPFVVAGVLALFVIVGIVAAVTGSNGTAAPTVTVPTPVAPTAAPAPVAAAPVPSAPVPAAGPSTTVGDGTYEVGVDMAAGKYKTTGPGADSITGMCYQQRAKDSSGEFGSIISNDLVQGPGVVTVKDGEVVTFSGGCEWAAQ